MELTTDKALDDTQRLSAIYRRMCWRLIPFLFLCYILAYFARINVSFAKLQMLADLSISETAYGLGAGIFFIGYVVFAVPSNLILERVGPKRWIGFLMVTWGTLTAAMMFTTDITSFYIFRFLIGVAEAGFFPGVIYYFTRWFPSERRAHVIAMFMAAAPLSSVVGGPVSGWVMSTLQSGAYGISNWQWLFLLYGIPTILVGLMVKSCLPNGYDDATFLDREEKSLIRIALEQDAKARQLHSSSTTPRSALAFLQSPVVWYFCVVYFFIEMGEYALGFWMPTIIKNSGYADLQSIGMLSALPYLIASVVMIMVGRSADLRNERRWHLAIPMLLGMVGLIIAVQFAHNGPVALFGLTLATCGVMAAFPVFWAVPTSLLGTSAAAGVAFINSIGNLAGLVSPWLVGLSIDLTSSTDLALYGVAACAFIGAMLFAFAPKFQHSR